MTTPTPPAAAPTPRTDALTAWCNDDARYKAPEQMAATFARHAELFHDKAVELETELAAKDARIAALEKDSVIMRQCLREIAEAVFNGEPISMLWAKTALQQLAGNDAAMQKGQKS